MRLQLATKLLVRVSTLALFPAHVAPPSQFRSGVHFTTGIRTAQVTMGASDSTLSTTDAGAVDDGAIVQNIHRFAVKGLGRDELPSITLQSGGGLPHDREWALIFSEQRASFDDAAPEWLHKSHFLCAFTANELVAQFRTAFDAATRALSVWRRSDGAALIGSARLDDPGGRAEVAAFFSNVSGRAVEVVSARARPHAFGNTASGWKATGDTRVVHLVNVNTVAAVAAASGTPLDAGRFRANVILGGTLPAWREFEWVGRTISVGGAVLKVVKRTVRCEGVNVDPRGSGRADLDVPALLQKHFPQHGPFLGVYAQVVSAGEVTVGDRVRVRPAG